MECESSSTQSDFVWATENVEDEEDIVVDEFLWPLINAIAQGRDLRTTPDLLHEMNRALTSSDFPFVYRLGNLGMTYDPDLIVSDNVEDDVLQTDTFADMLSELRNIYIAHEEEQAVQLLDMFMARASPCVVLHMPLNAVLGY
jgi:hypothetical protein